ncbi:chemotaxis-specific protein-glutamate methyltransferase CheB [Spirulina sp. CS-785/01]|uniref:chemotaxis-specific protein-glutamate methyltransferase CheB n=1 Tax=Spirulina sp. CS-785/01 TaxID=3021716 RepID=UPI00232C2B73|nr:chemotaxis-specific protein-glutamate methyltransferase CheB [Spirulina sp. CS-785/01]MDB9311483.1 chemotaxis-specific protein-glutamate methyltransferase CheB [Spirulina sp. CS-785/01]
MKPTKVLIVEDSPIARTILKRILQESPYTEVVGTAATGLEGLALLKEVNPDVVCTDLHMPKMNGLEFTSEVMATHPLPILVISTSVQEEDTKNVFELLDAGAVDIFPKPRGGEEDYNTIKKSLIEKIRILSGVKVFTRRKKTGGLPSSSSPVAKSSSSHREAKVSHPVASEEKKQPPVKTHIQPIPPKLQFQSPVYSSLKTKIVAIGASTGGPQALRTLLSPLPVKFPIPIICVQHISDGFLQGLLDWLTLCCSLPIKIAEEGEYPQGGVIYFPKERYHLEIDRFGRFHYSTTSPVGGHRPSITVTFQSIAKYYRSAALGVLLTGMGRDGAVGMQSIAQMGGKTIAQNEATSVVFGMPKEAIALGAAQQVLSLDAIAPAILKVMTD